MDKSPANTPAILLTSGTLIVSNADQFLAFNVTVSNNTLVKLGGVANPTNSLTGSINAKTGQLNVTFGNGIGKATTAGVGAMLQNSNTGAGYFVTRTNAGLIILLNNRSTFPPVIFQPPVSQAFAAGATNSFSVGATGSAPLSYQWVMDQANLANGGNISGATNSQLIIGPEVLSDAGSYAVIVSNAFGSATSSVVILTIPAPTVAIKSPGSTATSPALTIQGTASGKYGIADVQWRLNGGAWSSATTTNHWTNWFVSVTLQAGTNIFQAYSVDPIGNHSTTNGVTVFYTTQSPLTLRTNGFGKISGNFSGTNLVVGRNYTVTAVPNSGNLFSNWTGTITATNNPLTFLMMSNMTLTANFVTNSFLRAVGTYNGLFYDSINGVGAQSSGLLGNLTVGSPGTYSGKLYIGGTNYAVSGNFDVAGNASSQIARAANLGPLSLAMHLDWDAVPPQISGTVQGTNGGAWSAELTNELAATGLPSAEYTMLIPPGTNAPTNSPGGDGYALMTNHLGTITVTGALADGASFSQSIAESTNKLMAFYATPYTNGGLLLGWLDVSGGAPAGTLSWIRPAAAGGLYPGGYTNFVTVQSSAWTNLGPTTPALSLSHGAQLSASGKFSHRPAQLLRGADDKQHFHARAILVSAAAAVSSQSDQFAERFCRSQDRPVEH